MENLEESTAPLNATPVETEEQPTSQPQNLPNTPNTASNQQVEEGEIKETDSTDSAASAAQDGFEVIRRNQEELAQNSQNPQNDRFEILNNDEAMNSVSDSPHSLQIDESVDDNQSQISESNGDNINGTRDGIEPMDQTENSNEPHAAVPESHEANGAPQNSLIPGLAAQTPLGIPSSSAANLSGVPASVLGLSGAQTGLPNFSLAGVPNLGLTSQSLAGLGAAGAANLPVGGLSAANMPGLSAHGLVSSLQSAQNLVPGVNSTPRSVPSAPSTSVPSSSAANGTVDEEKTPSPYADVAKDPLLTLRPSNEVLQLLEQQSAEEKRIKEEKEREQNQQQAQLQQQQQLQQQLQQLNPALLNAQIPFDLFSAASAGNFNASALQQLQQAAAFAMNGKLTNPFSQSTVAAISQQLAAASRGQPVAFDVKTTSTTPSEIKQKKKKNEIYRYNANVPIYSLAWSSKFDTEAKLRLACSSIKDGTELLRNTMAIVEFDEEKNALVEKANVYIGTPSVGLQFIPNQSMGVPELIASATKELRIYSYDSEKTEVKLECKLQGKKATGFNGPLSALDWNSHDPALVGGCSIDSTVTLWDIEAQTRVATIHPDQYNQSLLKTKLRSQLIAHELPVHDIKFINATDMTTCSADGSIRSFDLRDLSNSQVLWDNPKNAELNHLAFNKMTQLHWAAIAAGSNDIYVGDIRQPGMLYAVFSKHQGVVNSIDFASKTLFNLVSGANDRQALIWSDKETEPMLAYPAEAEIAQVKWCPVDMSWIGISFKSCVEILRV